VLDIFITAIFDFSSPAAFILVNYRSYIVLFFNSFFQVLARLQIFVVYDNETVFEFVVFL